MDKSVEVLGKRTAHRKGLAVYAHVPKCLNVQGLEVTWLELRMALHLLYTIM